ncbi:MAG: hypothetical protein JWO06_1200 [Bacteroidota bacterium]|nr:hypothetical protein [Bacteroidota bacterium]
MKPLYLTLTLTLGLLRFGYVNAGEKALWGTMLSGGSSNKGVIYKVNPDGSNGAVAVTFTGANGANPSGNMVEGPGDKLYGTTTAGGQYNYGVLFSFDLTTNQYVKLHDFDSVSGWAPRDLVLSTDGKIYGTTEAGGLHKTGTALQGSGIVYSYDLSNDSFTKLFDFDSTNGENPQGLMQASNNKLYGLTRQGGAYNAGVMYSYTLGVGISKLFDFNPATNGALPTNCKLIQASDNKLYGMTTWGGADNMGTLFNFDIASYRWHKLYDFNGVNGSYPSSSLVQANNGVLYGVSLYGGDHNYGVIFKYNVSTNGYANLYSFNGPQGAVPFGSMIQGSDDLLYGMTSQGGANGTGVIYDYNISSDNYEVVRDCGPAAGDNPMSNLLELAGTTGIANVSAEQISLYPNPATSQVMIGYNGFKAESLKIYDSKGQLLLVTKYENQLQISDLRPGIYFIEMQKGQEFLRTRFTKI